MSKKNRLLIELCAVFGVLMILTGIILPHFFAAQRIQSVTLPGKVKMKFCRIPAGNFVCGSPAAEEGHHSNEGPQTPKKITRPFCLSMYEVTQKQWQAVMKNNPSYFPKSPNHPVDKVSWNDCLTYVEKMNGLGIGTFRLPTKIEWEYACRAGTTTRFYWGEDENESSIGEYAWYAGNANKTTHPVGLKKPNAWNLYDINGNVWEWCVDSFGKSYKENRGGCWKDTPSFHRSAFHGFSPPDYGGWELGLRLVMEIE